MEWIGKNSREYIDVKNGTETENRVKLIQIIG